MHSMTHGAGVCSHRCLVLNIVCHLCLQVVGHIHRMHYNYMFAPDSKALTMKMHGQYNWWAVQHGSTTWAVQLVGCQLSSTGRIAWLCGQLHVLITICMVATTSVVLG
jgi:hypothetical protein